MKFFCLSSEYSRYLHSHLDTPLSEYSPDVDLDGRLRDLWVKGLPFNAKVGRVVNILWMVKNSKRILQLKFWLDLKLAKLVWMENLYCICIVVELQWTTWNTASYTVSNKLDFTESVFKRTKNSTVKSLKPSLFVCFQYVVFFLFYWENVFFALFPTERSRRFPLATWAQMHR